MAWRRAPLLLAALVQARESAAASSKKEAGEDRGHSVSTRVDPLSSSFYFDVIKPKEKRLIRGAQQLMSSEKAKWALGAVACGLLEMVVGQWAFSNIMKAVSGGRFARRNTSPATTTSDSEATQPTLRKEEQPNFQDSSSSSRNAMAGSSALAFLAAAVALGRQRARNRAVPRSISTCSEVVINNNCGSPNDSDVSTSIDVTPGRRRSSSTLGEGSDDKNEDSFGSSDDDLESPPIEGCSNVMRRHTTEPPGQTSANLTPRKGSKSRRMSSGGMLRQRSWLPEGTNIDINFDEDQRRTDGVQYGHKGFVRQRTKEYERRIDFHRISSEHSEVQSVGEDTWEAGNVDLKTVFYRISTDMSVANAAVPH